MLFRMVDHQGKELIIWLGLVAAAAAAMYVFYGLWVIAVIPGAVLTYLVVKPGAGGITRLLTLPKSFSISVAMSGTPMHQARSWSWKGSLNWWTARRRS